MYCSLQKLLQFFISYAATYMYLYVHAAARAVIILLCLWFWRSAALPSELFGGNCPPCPPCPPAENLSSHCTENSHPSLWGLKCQTKWSLYSQNEFVFRPGLDPGIWVLGHTHSHSHTNRCDYGCGPNF